MLSKIIKELQNPDKEFSPIPFWFLNDRLEKSELERQMTDFKSKGVDGVVLHPRIGLPQDFKYLSEEYFDIIKFIVKTAKELDMKIVLYDEAMYPSGSAHGEVVKSNPDFASVGITLTDNPHGGKIIAKFDDGYFLVSKKCGGTIRGIHYGEDDGEINAPLSADILNPQAVDKFIELTHESYFSRLSEYFGDTIIGFFTDEPCILGRNSRGFFEWTDGLENDINSAGGDIAELRALFSGEANRTTKIYKRLIIEKLNQNYYKKLSDWCTAHKIALMGHPKESDDIDEEMHFHIPGQDLVFRLISPEKGGVDGVNSVQAKCSSDAARHSGKRRNSNECFGVCSRNGIDWYFTAGDMKWFIDWLAVRGVNMFIPHAFYYSVDGKRKDERPPDVGPNNIWWKHYKLFSDYIKRVSYIMTDSVNCAKTAILCRSGDLKPELAKEFYESQTEFNYLPYSLLDKAEVKNNRLIIGEYAYDYIIGDTELDVRKISRAADVKEKDFRADGAKNLRVSHIVKNGVHMYFVVNEGEFDINTNVEMSVSGTPVLMNLWSGEYYGTEFTECDLGTRINLSLKRHESVLILFDRNGGKYDFAPKRDNIKPNFKLTDENKSEFTKTYIAEYIKSGDTQNEFFEINCEEMAECYVNGKFVGVSFFNHEFNIGDYLTNGKNEIKIVVTGSIANKYSEPVPYGIF
jgi:hypothetical protein